MFVDEAGQWQIPCIVLEEGDTADAVIKRCRQVGAVTHDDGEQFCVFIRERVGPEMWTESALRRALPIG